MNSASTRRGLAAVGVPIAAIVVAIALLVGGNGTPAVDRADPSDPTQVALGEAVYRVHCAACHGDELEGEPDWRRRGPDGRLPAPPHDETGHTWHHADEVLFRITKDGVAAVVPGYESNMPAFGDVLSDDEIWAVLAFIKSRWPEPVREQQAEIDRRTREAR